MRIINFRYHKLRVGAKVKLIKEYVNGNIILRIGDVGIVNGAKIEHFPDLGLFDIRILHISFNGSDLYIGDQVAEEYMEAI